MANRDSVFSFIGGSEPFGDLIEASMLAYRHTEFIFVSIFNWPLATRDVTSWNSPAYMKTSISSLNLSKLLLEGKAVEGFALNEHPRCIEKLIEDAHAALTIVESLRAQASYFPQRMHFIELQAVESQPALTPVPEVSAIPTIPAVAAVPSMPVVLPGAVAAPASSPLAEHLAPITADALDVREGNATALPTDLPAVVSEPEISAPLVAQAPEGVEDSTHDAAPELPSVEAPTQVSTPLPAASSTTTGDEPESAKTPESAKQPSAEPLNKEAPQSDPQEKPAAGAEVKTDIPANTPPANENTAPSAKPTEAQTGFARWTEEEDARLTNGFGAEGKNIGELAQAHNRSYRAIALRLLKLNQITQAQCDTLILHWNTANRQRH